MYTESMPEPYLMEPTVWEGMELPTGKLAFGRGEQQGDQTAGPRVSDRRGAVGWNSLGRRGREGPGVEDGPFLGGTAPGDRPGESASSEEGVGA